MRKRQGIPSSDFFHGSRYLHCVALWRAVCNSGLEVLEAWSIMKLFLFVKLFQAVSTNWVGLDVSTVGNTIPKEMYFVIRWKLIHTFERTLPQLWAQWWGRETTAGCSSCWRRGFGSRDHRAAHWGTETPEAIHNKLDCRKAIPKNANEDIHDHCIVSESKARKSCHDYERDRKDLTPKELSPKFNNAVTFGPTQPGQNSIIPLSVHLLMCHLLKYIPTFHHITWGDNDLSMTLE